jgi:hypothetical protein
MQDSGRAQKGHYGRKRKGVPDRGKLTRFSGEKPWICHLCAPDRPGEVSEGQEGVVFPGFVPIMASRM